MDDALGKFVNELKAQNLYDSTLIIVSAKHGQSPINVQDRVAISDALYAHTPGFGSNGFEICDDEALVWLSPELQQATNPATGRPYYADAKAYILATPPTCISRSCSIATNSPGSTRIRSTTAGCRTSSPSPITV